MHNKIETATERHFGPSHREKMVYEWSKQQK